MGGLRWAAACSRQQPAMSRKLSYEVLRKKYATAPCAESGARSVQDKSCRSEEEGFFFEKKKQKTFLNSAVLVSLPLAQRSKKFLRRFFQKRLLSCFRPRRARPPDNRIFPAGSAPENVSLLQCALMR
jgi:hypothetical protein